MSSNEKLYPYFLSLSLENVRCFGPEQTLDLTDADGKPARWTLILGENGTGKTTLLRAIAASYFWDNNMSSFKSEITISDMLPKEIDSNYFLRTPDDNSVIDFKFAMKKSIIEELNSSNTSEHFFAFIGSGYKFGANFTPERSTFNSLLGYGASRIIDTSAITEKMRSFAPATLFDEQAKLFNVEEWLIQEDYKRLASKSPIQSQRLERIKSLILDLLSEEISDIRFETEGDAPHVLFKTFSGWVKIHEMSLGYKTLMAWVIDAARWMFEVYEKELDNPLSGPAIMLVDEIDLHMHPALQRRLFDFLTEKFSNTQFVVTAHSPLIVQASQDANIAVLTREGDHVVIENNPINIKNWRVDQILTSDLFGLESAHNPHTEELLKQRVILTQKEARSKAEEDQLQQLNKMVEAMPTGSDSAEREAESIVDEIAEMIRQDKMKAK